MSSKMHNRNGSQQNPKQRSSKSVFSNAKPFTQHSPEVDAIIQRAKLNPDSLAARDVIQLQRTVGNQAVAQLLSQPSSSKEELTPYITSDNPVPLSQSPTIIQRTLAINYGDDKQIYKKKGDINKLISELDRINEEQLGHSIYSNLSKDEKMKRLRGPVEGKDNYKFEYVSEDRPNPKTGQNEPYWWKVTTPSGKNYSLYSYEAWQVIFDTLFYDVSDSQPKKKSVNLIWTCGDKKKGQVLAYRKLEERLLEPANYNQITGEPNFNNAHIDDTSTAQWKLQADVVEMGAGSVDRLHINVNVDDDNINVTIADLSRNTH